MAECPWEHGSPSRSWSSLIPLPLLLLELAIVQHCLLSHGESPRCPMRQLESRSTLSTEGTALQGRVTALEESVRQMKLRSTSHLAGVAPLKTEEVPVAEARVATAPFTEQRQRIPSKLREIAGGLCSVTALRDGSHYTGASCASGEFSSRRRV